MTYVVNRVMSWELHLRRFSVPFLRVESIPAKQQKDPIRRPMNTSSTMARDHFSTVERRSYLLCTGTMRHHRLLLLIVKFLCALTKTSAFVVRPLCSLQKGRHLHQPNKVAASIRWNSNNQDNDNQNDDLDNFLDKPFFDPDEFEDKEGTLGWFARLVKNDYELAETLFVGTFFVVLLIVTQEVLRMQLYGDNYVPFLKGGATGGGKLF